MNRKQSIALIFCSLVIWCGGNGIAGLLPVYATQLGASSAVAGNYLAIIFFNLALGTLSAGWVSEKLHRRKLPMIIMGCMYALFTWLMSLAHSMLALATFTAISWFCGGMALALITILAGMYVRENERGKVFGFLAMTMGLGGVIGGLGIGWLVNRWGYTTMFRILALWLTLQPLVALLLEDKKEGQPQAKDIPVGKSPALGKNFYLFFTATILVTIPGYFAALIRSIVMNSRGFNPLDINSTVAIGGLIAIPFPLLMGWISDKIGRKTFLFFSYFSGLASLVLLAFSQELWHFWAAFSLAGISSGGGGVGNALVTDLAPPESLAKGLAVFGSAAWIGGVLGFAAAGYLLQNLGLPLTFMIGGCLMLVAIGLLIQIRTGSRQPGQPVEAST